MFKSRLTVHHCAVLLVVSLSGVGVAEGFSDGSKLSQGSSATRKLYCFRPPESREPLHFQESCNGYCEPRLDFDTFYTINLSSATYWLSLVTVNISARPGSGKSVTGFSVYAIDESGDVAGSFLEDDNDVLVGSCSDVISISDETHGAFHKMANFSRKNVSVIWQPDGYNHGRVRFVVWIVNTHSDVYFTETQWLTSEKHGSDSLDVAASLRMIVMNVDIEDFEKGFQFRWTKGYQLDLANPFDVFSKPPLKQELIQVNSLQADGFENTRPVSNESFIYGFNEKNDETNGSHDVQNEAQSVQIFGPSNTDTKVHPFGPSNTNTTVHPFGHSNTNTTVHPFGPSNTNTTA